MIDNHLPSEDGEKCNCPSCNPRLVFNKAEIFEEEIQPVMKKLLDLCDKHGLPMIASVTFACGLAPNNGHVLRMSTGGNPRDGWMPEEYVIARRVITADKSHMKMIEIDLSEVDPFGAKAKYVHAAFEGVEKELEDIEPATRCDYIPGSVGFIVPEGVRLFSQEGATREQILGTLDKRPIEDLRFAISVLKSHDSYPLLTKAITIAALKEGNTRDILSKVTECVDEVAKSVSPTPDDTELHARRFMDEMNFLATEYHVRIVCDVMKKD